MTDPDAKDSVNLPPGGDAPVGKTEAPDLANLMGFGGLIPFFLCAGVAHSGVSPWNMLAFMACGIYGGIILSFIGAVHWGLAMQDGRPQRYFVWSVMPAIYAWPMVVTLDAELTLLALIPGFLIAWGVDYRAWEAGLLPGWYMRLRHILTLGATLAMAAASLAVTSYSYH